MSLVTCHGLKQLHSYVARSIYSTVIQILKIESAGYLSYWGFTWLFRYLFQPLAYVGSLSVTQTAMLVLGYQSSEAG